MQLKQSDNSGVFLSFIVNRNGAHLQTFSKQKRGDLSYRDE